MSRRAGGGGLKPGTAAWYAALAVGTVLIVFPEPATTATGLLIVAGTLAVAPPR